MQTGSISSAILGKGSESINEFLEYLEGQARDRKIKKQQQPLEGVEAYEVFELNVRVPVAIAAQPKANAVQELEHVVITYNPASMVSENEKSAEINCLSECLCCFQQPVVSINFAIEGPEDLKTLEDFIKMMNQAASAKRLDWHFNIPAIADAKLKKGYDSIIQKTLGQDDAAPGLMQERHSTRELQLGAAEEALSDAIVSEEEDDEFLSSELESLSRKRDEQQQERHDEEERDRASVFSRQRFLDKPAAAIPNQRKAQQEPQSQLARREAFTLRPRGSFGHWPNSSRKKLLGQSHASAADDSSESLFREAQLKNHMLDALLESQGVLVPAHRLEPSRQEPLEMGEHLFQVLKQMWDQNPALRRVAATSEPFIERLATKFIFTPKQMQEIQAALAQERKASKTGSKTEKGFRAVADDLSKPLARKRLPHSSPTNASIAVSNGQYRQKQELPFYESPRFVPLLRPSDFWNNYFQSPSKASKKKLLDQSHASAADDSSESLFREAQLKNHMLDALLESQGVLVPAHRLEPSRQERLEMGEHLFRVLKQMWDQNPALRHVAATSEPFIERLAKKFIFTPKQMQEIQAALAQERKASKTGSKTEKGFRAVADDLSKPLARKRLPHSSPTNASIARSTSQYRWEKEQSLFQKLGRANLLTPFSYRKSRFENEQKSSKKRLGYSPGFASNYSPIWGADFTAQTVSRSYPSAMASEYYASEPIIEALREQLADKRLLLSMLETFQLFLKSRSYLKAPGFDSDRDSELSIKLRNGQLIFDEQFVSLIQDFFKRYPDFYNSLLKNPSILKTVANFLMTTPEGLSNALMSPLSQSSEKQEGVNKVEPHKIQPPVKAPSRPQVIRQSDHSLFRAPIIRRLKKEHQMFSQQSLNPGILPLKRNNWRGFYSAASYRLPGSLWQLPLYSGFTKMRLDQAMRNNSALHALGSQQVAQQSYLAEKNSLLASPVVWVPLAMFAYSFVTDSSSRQEIMSCVLNTATVLTRSIWDLQAEIMKDNTVGKTLQPIGRDVINQSVRVFVAAAKNSH